MARLLLLATSTGKTGRVEGDPVFVGDDSHVFGEREDKRVWIANGNAEGDWPGIFYVIDIPGMPVEVARRIYDTWKRPATILDPEFEAPDEADRYVVLGRHRWQLGVADKIPGAARSKLRRDGFIEFPYVVDVINSYMRDRSELDTFVPGAGGPIDP